MGDKFTVLRCLGRTKPVVDSIDTVRGELTKDLREKKLRVAMAREFENLRQQSKIENLLAKPAPYTGAGSLAKPVSYEAPSAARKPAAQRTAPQAPLPSR